jgi:hypothetical protein
MRTGLLTIAGAGVLLLAGVTSSTASDVNCGIVMKSVKMGRSAQDIADTMMISTSDVEECKKKAAEAPKDGQPANTEKPVAEKPPAEVKH